jgi:integrase
MMQQVAAPVPKHPKDAGGVFTPTIQQAIDELIAAKQSANRRERYLKSLRYYLQQFARGREQTLLAAFTTADVEQWMATYSGAAARQTWLNRLSTLFSWAARRGLIAENPTLRIERVSVDRKPPAILTPAQADLLLRVVPNICRPYLILGIFAGIRPEEIMRLDWHAVDLETKTVRVDGKTRRRRIVDLEPKAVALLANFPLRTGPIAPHLTTLRRFKTKARAALGLKRFPQDLLRHTFASYALALHGDAGKVSTQMGNSSAVLLSHYHEPVTKADCAFFWDLNGRTKYDQSGLATAGATAQALPDGKTGRTEHEQARSDGLQTTVEKPPQEKPLTAAGSLSKNCV